MIDGERGALEAREGAEPVVNEAGAGAAVEAPVGAPAATGASEAAGAADAAGDAYGRLPTVRTMKGPIPVIDPAALAAGSGRIAIGIDVGGSGIKAAAVDTATGRLVSARIRVPTPEPSTPEAVLASVGRIARRIRKALDRPDVPVGVDVPSVVLGGVTMTAANIDAAWVEYPALDRLRKVVGDKVALINDADAAGLAEMRFGAGRGKTGAVLVLTLGTGVGSGLFIDGILVPNTELGHMEIRGRDAERRSAAAARLRRGLSWKAWTADLDEHLQAINRILWPDLIIIGGGVSKNADKFIPKLTVRPPVVPAALRNEAGIVGAAMWAIEHVATGAGGSAEAGTPADPGAPDDWAGQTAGEPADQTADAADNEPGSEASPEANADPPADAPAVDLGAGL